jgi:hypothetical protein
VQWFVKWIGNVGTGAMLALAVFSYFIWRFNPVFKLPEWKFAAIKTMLLTLLIAGRR